MDSLKKKISLSEFYSIEDNNKKENNYELIQGTVLNKNIKLSNKQYHMLNHSNYPTQTSTKEKVLQYDEEIILKVKTSKLEENSNINPNRSSLKEKNMERLHFEDEELEDLFNDNDNDDEDNDINNDDKNTNTVSINKVDIEDEEENEDVYYIILKNKWSSIIDYICIDQRVCIYGKLIETKSSLKIVEVSESSDKLLFIIIEPEYILSPSSIKIGFPCLRKPIFTLSYKNNEAGCNYMAIGEILHSIFQRIIQNNDLMLDFDKLVKEEIERLKLTLLPLFSSEKEIFNSIYDFKDRLDHLFQHFFFKKSKLFSFLPSFSNEKSKIDCINDVEKGFQSQILGSNGIADVIVSIEEEVNPSSSSSSSEKKMIKKYKVPLEIKSGSQKNDDYIQMVLYSIIINHIFDTNNNSGILLYLKKKQINKYNIRQSEIIDVLLIRNKVAYYLKNFEEVYYFYNKGLPDLAKKGDCQNCFVRQSCYINYISFESHHADYDKNIHEREEMIILKSKLTKEYIEYYKYYLDLINKEEAFQLKERNFFWSSHVKKREFIENFSPSEGYKVYDILSISEGMKSMTFYLEDICLEDVSDFESKSMTDMHYVYDSERRELMKGLIVYRYRSSQKETVLVLNVLEIYISNDYKDYIKSVFFKGNPKKTKKIRLYLKPFECYMNKNNKNLRNSLINLYSNDSLCSKIIQMQAPDYEILQKNEIIHMINKAKISFSSFNEQQKLVLIKFLLMKNYILIKGYPGTGKTLTIVNLIKLSLALNMKVLICSHTNQAVDNILLKLQLDGIEFIRVTNNINYIDNRLRKEALIEISKSMSFDDLKQKVETCKIFSSTVAGIISPLFNSMKFDICIIDEACQILEPYTVQALLKAEKFILCGDPYQLSPILKSSTEKIIGLFERLENAHPYSCVTLKVQYRMNYEIMKLSNECVYQNEMKCDLSNESRVLEYKEGKENKEIQYDLYEKEYIKNNKWILDAVDSNKPVIFLDYNRYLIEESIGIKEKVSNFVEINIVSLVIKALIDLKYDLNQVTVITPYRSQETRMRSKLNEQYGFDDVITIDKSQGIEKDIIIISFVKVDALSRILSDIQRINVAFTRAKRKLIIVGLFDILNQVSFLNEYMKIIQRNGWVREVRSVKC